MSNVNRLNQSMSQKQMQSLLLRPKMLQSLEMLTMPLLELELYIKQELETNPMMEMQELRDENEEKQNLEEEKPESEKTEAEVDEELKRTLEESEKLSEVLDSWNEQFDDYSSRSSGGEKVDFEKFMKSKEMKITDFFDQLEELNFADNEYDFAYDLIDSTNEHGYLPAEFSVTDFATDYDISPLRAEELHKIILNLDPKGITARNIQECLYAQLDEEQRKNSLLVHLIQEDFSDLIHKRYKKIASKYNLTTQTILQYRNIISQLDPKPGLRLLNSQSDYIMPDVIIKMIGDDYEVIINDYFFPKIRMSRRYKTVLKELGSDKKAVEYVRGKINSAKFLIKSIYLRNRTLKRVVKSIIKHQHEFFYENSGTLKPLVYSVIADELQVNESTISRVVRTKYADTPFGIMCLKDFFTSKAGKDLNYDAVSRHKVEKLLKKYIAEEDSDNPLSDQDIAVRLETEGIKVSRRVVAKYRKLLGILNSHLRKK